MMFDRNSRTKTKTAMPPVTPAGTRLFRYPTKPFARMPSTL